MIVHVRVHALVSLAASAAWLDKKREPNRRQTTNRQVSFIGVDVCMYVCMHVPNATAHFKLHFDSRSGY